jgi:hypothetical protein
MVTSPEKQKVKVLSQKNSPLSGKGFVVESKVITSGAQTGRRGGAGEEFAWR